MQLHSRGETLDLTYPRVMGILNITPDSFSDGGRYYSLDNALSHAQQMVEAGAAILDIGGESTRPSASHVSVDEELSRVIPIIEKLTYYFDIWISVDTSKPEVISEAAAAGAHLINDVRALRTAGALEAVIQSELPVCLMHMQGEPHNMQNTPYYDDVIKEVSSFFQQQITRCCQAGLKLSQILLDPGFGFGKDITHNYQLLANLSTFHQFGLPLLVGMSRKSMIGQLLNTPPDGRLAGSLSCAVLAAMQGVHIIRAHDVGETVEAMRVVEAMQIAKDKK